MKKPERLQVIRDLVSSSLVTTQGELVGELTKRGYQVTQSSISRDIDELGITKIDGHYSLAVKTKNPGLELASLEAIGSNLIVAKCASGLASAITVQIDAQYFDSIAGTIAGDDTIFIAVRDEDEQAKAIQTIREMFTMK